MHLLLAVYAALAGLVTGSYLNVVIHRLPRGLSTVMPRSRCPSCGEPVRAVDNLPILSWLILRGRCRSCGLRISPIYPLVEALTATLFVLVFLRFGVSLGSVVGIIFVSSMIALAGIDAEHFLLPDRITLPGIVVGIALAGWLPGGSWLSGVIGALFGGGILLLMYGLWWLVRREEGLGLGDVKMLAMVGAFLGWQGALVTLLIGALAGALVGVGVMVVARTGLKTRLPFGVFLAIGGIVALLVGDDLINAYLQGSGLAGADPSGPYLR